jgi:manganese/zinc/iron transport system substrate-binding protein
MRAAADHSGRRRPLAVLATLIAAAAAFAATGCGSSGGAATAADGDRLEVVTTTNWHRDLAERIGGERVTVTGLMGPGVDPHLYEATAGDVRTLADADVAIWNGLELEGKMDEVFEQVERSVPVVAVGEAVPEDELIAIAGGGGEFDPHIWFDADAWARAAEAVADAYKDVDPGHAAGYDRRLDRFRAELEETERYARDRIEAIPERSRVLVTSHDAFSYLARAYGLEVAPIQGKSTAGEATTADIERVAAAVADAGLGAVFIESSVPQQTIDAVLAAARQRGQATEVGGELYGDALGAPGSPEGTWTGAVKHNVDAIAAGLGG